MKTYQECVSENDEANKKSSLLISHGYINSFCFGDERYKEETTTIGPIIPECKSLIGLT